MRRPRARPGFPARTLPASLPRLVLERQASTNVTGRATDGGVRRHPALEGADAAGGPCRRAARPPPRLDAPRRRRRGRRLWPVGDRRHHAARCAGEPELLPGPPGDLRRDRRPRARRRRPPRPVRLPALLARALRRDGRAHAPRHPRRRRDPRLEAVDRRRLLPFPALGVREAPVRPRARGLPRRPGAEDRRAADDAHGARPGARPDLPRLPPARPRHGARLRRGPRRDPLRRGHAVDAARGARRRGGAVRDRRPVGAPGGRDPGAQAVSDPPPDAVHEPDERPARRDLQHHAVDHDRRRGRRPRARRRRIDADEPRLPPGARDRLRVRLARRAARLPRRIAPALPLPDPRLARLAHRHPRARPLLGARRGRRRRRLPLPDLRQRRGLLDDREPRGDGRPPVHLRARPRTPVVAAPALKPLAVWGVLKELRLAASDERALAVAGAPELAAALVRELIRGGDPNALVGPDDFDRAAALVYVLVGRPSAADEDVLKAARRARVPAVCLVAGPKLDGYVPHVLATDVVRARPGEGFPVDELVRALAARLGEAATPLAARLPVLRDAVRDYLIESFARRNAVVGAAVFVPGADLPVLTLNQIRLVLRLGSAYGVEIDAERLPELLGVLGAGFGFRAVAREALDVVPVAGWVLKGLVAYAGTRALGEAARRYFEARTERAAP